MRDFPAITLWQPWASLATGRQGWWNVSLEPPAQLGE